MACNDNLSKHIRNWLPTAYASTIVNIFGCLGDVQLGEQSPSSLIWLMWVAKGFFVLEFDPRWFLQIITKNEGHLKMKLS